MGDNKISSQLKSSERRVVTVISADIINSTQLIAGLDPDDALDLIDPVVDIMISNIETMGGLVLGVHGDGVIAAFGVFGDQENHAVRAILSGQALCNELPHIRYPKGINRPSIRVGIHSGYVIVRQRAGQVDLIGDTVHIASKVENCAGLNKILISEPTVALISNEFEFRDYDHAVAGFKLFEVTSKGSTSQISAHKSGSPFLGRDDLFSELIHDVFRPQLDHKSIGLIGEAGMGKTRLLEQFQSELTDRSTDFGVIKGSSVNKDSPYFALSQFFQSHTSLQKFDDLIAEKKVASDPLRTGVLFLLQPEERKNLTQKLRPEAILKSVQSASIFLINEMIGSERFVLIVEDTHFLDLESWMLIESFTKAFLNSELVIIFSSRPEGQNRLGRTIEKTITIGPVDDEAAKEIVKFISNGKVGFDDPLTKEILARSNGMPLAIVEFTRTLSGTDDPGLSKNVPISLEPLLRQKLDRLNSSARQVIDMMSVYGMKMDPLILQRIFTHNSVEWRDIVNELESSDLIVPYHKNAIEFSHQIFQEVCYKAMPRRVSREKHEQVYNALINARFEIGYSADHQILARHAVKSGFDQFALDHLWSAKKEAIEISALDTIQTLYFRAADICDELDTDEFFLQKVKFASRAFVAFQQLAQENELIPIFEKAIDNFAPALTPTLTSILHCHISSARWLNGEPGAIENALAAMEISKSENAPALTARAGFMLANGLFASGEPQKAADVIIGIIESASPEFLDQTSGNSIFLPGPQFRIFASWYLIEIGDYDRAKKLYEKARAISERENHLHSQLIADLSIGYRHYRQFNFEEAARAFATTYDRCLEHLHFGFAPLVAAWSVLCFLENGELEKAKSLLEQEIKHNRYFEQRRNCYYFYILQAQARISEVEKNYDKAESFFVAALKHAESISDPVHQAYGNFEYGAFLTRRGEKDAPGFMASAKKLATQCQMKPLLKRIEC